MNAVLTKYQKQQLGDILPRENYTKDDFAYEELTDKDGSDYAVLTCRDSSDYFRIKHVLSSNSYLTNYSVPGTNRIMKYNSGTPWDNVLSRFTDWLEEVRQENEAIDPWQQKAEEMANDDSYFTVAELPKVDQAIQDALDNLKHQALEHGKTVKQIEGQLADIKHILEKSARTATKREWMAIFKGIIIDKLVDWGMQTAIFQTVLHTLMTSATEVTQLAEHASKYLQ